MNSITLIVFIVYLQSVKNYFSAKQFDTLCNHYFLENIYPLSPFRRVDMARYPSSLLRDAYSSMASRKSP